MRRSQRDAGNPSRFHIIGDWQMPPPKLLSLLPHRRVYYSREVADHICEQLRLGRPLVDICRDPGMPRDSAVRLWAAQDRDGFSARFHEARGERDGKHGMVPFYRNEIADYICDELGSGRTLNSICQDEGMPPITTVYAWVKQDYQGFAARYKLAREIGYHVMVDEIIDIADEAIFPERVPGARVRMDARRWLASTALPRIYGNRLNLNATHEPVDTLAEVMRVIDGRTRGLPQDD